MTTPNPLRSGRRTADDLSAEQVAEHQRTRMLYAMTSAAAELGYVAVTVADVIARAKVSRATFYQQFTDKTDCFLAAYDYATTLLMQVIGDGHGATPTPVGLIVGYLDALAEHPDEARVFMVEIGALGAAGASRRAHSIDTATDVLAELAGASDGAGRFACRTVVASVSMLASLRLADGDLDGLRALRAPMSELVERLLPSP